MKIKTTRSKLAHLINDDWYYSMHWKDDTWREQARSDVDRAMEYAKERVSNLEKAKHILDSE